MDVEKFSWRMIELMPQIAREISRYENNYLTRGKITLPQFWLLEYLSRQGESKMSHVAQTLGISKPATTGLIARLIAQKLVGRRDDQDDRRVVWIALTAKGKNIIQNIRRQKHRTLVKMFGGVSAQDRARHLQMFEQMVKNLDASVKSKQAGARLKTE